MAEIIDGIANHHEGHTPAELVGYQRVTEHGEFADAPHWQAGKHFELAWVGDHSHIDVLAESETGVDYTFHVVAEAWTGVYEGGEDGFFLTLTSDSERYRFEIH